MHGTKFFSFKHNAQAEVTNEPETRNGYFTVWFPALNMYRRYSGSRIRSEMEDQYSVGRQLAEQGIPAPMPALAVKIDGMVLGMSRDKMEQAGIAVAQPKKTSTKKMGTLICLVFE